jgi:putative ABC transport system substrate-binding protein
MRRGFGIPAMGGKWLQMLREVAVRAIEAAAPTLGLHVTVAPVRSAAEIEGVISVFARDANGALLIVADFITLVHRELIVALAARHRLPAMYNLIAFVKSGGLMSYGKTRPISSDGRRLMLTVS